MTGNNHKIPKVDPGLAAIDTSCYTSPGLTPLNLLLNIMYHYYILSDIYTFIQGSTPLILILHNIKVMVGLGSSQILVSKFSNQN